MYCLKSWKERQSIRIVLLFSFKMLWFSCFVFAPNTVKSNFKTIWFVKHVRKHNTQIIICHYSVCAIYDLSKAGRSTWLLVILNHHAFYKLCFLYGEKLFSLILDLNKTIVVAFIRCLVKTTTTTKRTKLNGKTTLYCSPDFCQFF